ncbi:transposase [Emticicia sp. 21SJ11W-3]|uniref:transposase n=1 Tax=Emticicia sp. 21SJ11W-3 TaxID=2916755 RepID=UPI00209FD901|nr:transposase [Emticicia sp. 21SJ11W-3]UTA66647.1 transposase [Emticicia sp. 21SJ11W-3]
MMKKTRRKFTSAFKWKVSIEAVKEQQTLSDLAVKYSLQPAVISKWKQEFLDLSSGVFDKSSGAIQEPELDINNLYAKIGQLEMENDFLKKNIKKAGL